MVIKESQTVTVSSHLKMSEGKDLLLGTLKVANSQMNPTGERPSVAQTSLRQRSSLQTS